MFLLGDMMNEKLRIDTEGKVSVKEFEARAKNSGLEIDKSFFSDALISAGFMEEGGMILEELHSKNIVDIIPYQAA